jgi:hypothetical protein
VATINRAAFSVSWTTTYPAALAAPVPLATRAGYEAAYYDLGDTLRLPWESARGSRHWSRFWSSYLGAPKRLRQLGADIAWDHVIPFLREHAATVSGPGDLEVRADVLVYPGAISVIIMVTVAGEWTLGELATSLWQLRTSTSWALATPERTSHDRNLAGIASELRDRAAVELADGAAVPEPGPVTVHTVAAPLTATGEPAEFALTDPAASSCLVGLSVLGPPGVLDPTHLLPTSANPYHAGAVYTLGEGHGIWHPAYLLAQPRTDPIGCLHRNHTDLAAHIAALGGIAGWAGDQVRAKVRVGEAQPLVRQAVKHLRRLHDGSAKTYRAGVAKSQIEPMLDTLATLDLVLGRA